MARTPLERIRRGGLVLCVVFVLSVLGYRWIGGYGWIDAIWMVTITISTVGYGEATSSLPKPTQILTLFVILAGVTASVYTFTGLFQMMVKGELEHVLGRQRMTKGIKLLAGHAVICGYGRMGKTLAFELRRQGKQCVVVDSSIESIAEATADGFLSLLGDATEESTLRQAGLVKAGVLVSTFPNDAESVFITLTARELNPNVRIIARAERETTEKKLLQAGADTVVMPTVVGARQMGRLITRPTTAQLIRLVDENANSDIELDELRVGAESGLIGMRIEDTQAHRLHHLLVIAIKSPQGEFTFNPGADETIAKHDELMILGRKKDIASFRKAYSI